MKKEIKKAEPVVKVTAPEPTGSWKDVFDTVIEEPGGGQLLATIQQNDLTKEIRAIKR